MTRKEANLLILEELSKIINYYPDLRFNQVLVMFNLNELPFYEESVVTLDRINNE